MPRPRYTGFETTRQDFTFNATTEKVAYTGKEYADSAFKVLGLQLGALSSSVTTFVGFTLTAAKPDCLRVCVDEAATSIAAGYSGQAILGRCLVAGAQIHGNSFSGVKGQLKFAGTSILQTGQGGSGYATSRFSGMWGYLENSGTVTIGHTSTANYVYACGVRATLDGGTTLTIQASGRVAALLLDMITTPTNTAGLLSCIYVKAPDDGGSFESFVNFATGTAYECGVKIGSMSALGGVTHAASGLVKVKVAGTAYFIPLYAAGDLTGE
jgi:hypothetical protein